jgi:hypothetical protein
MPLIPFEKVVRLTEAEVLTKIALFHFTINNPNPRVSRIWSYNFELYHVPNSATADTAAGNHHRKNEPDGALTECFKTFECLGFEITGSTVSRQQLVKSLLVNEPNSKKGRAKGDY